MASLRADAERARRRRARRIGAVGFVGAVALPIVLWHRVIADIACAVGQVQLARLDGMLADRARVAGWYREALGGLEGLGLPCEDAGGDRRGWFVFVVQVPRGRDRDEVIHALRLRGVQCKPYLPAIHLMSFYRERFGHREGEFPVCEDVAARSVALPFFPAMTENQVQRVGAALAEAVGQGP